MPAPRARPRIAPPRDVRGSWGSRLAPERRLNLFTIGANETLAESFFGRLADRGVRTVVDVRVSRDSAFFGFAKERDLPYYLRKLCGAGYRVEESLAPTRELLRERERGLPWAAYEREYRSLLERRDAIASLRRDDFEGACL